MFATPLLIIGIVLLVTHALLSSLIVMLVRMLEYVLDVLEPRSFRLEELPVLSLPPIVLPLTL